MSATYEIIERVGISNKSNSDAINSAVTQASGEKKISWFEVIEQRGRVIDEGNVEYQVTLKIGRKL